MASEWTSSGLDSVLSVDRASSEPIGRQLQRQLREAIRDGRLAAGDRLPSTRQFAADHGVSRGTVVEAFTQLEAEGYLVTRHGAGTAVAHGVGTAAPAAAVRARPAVSIDFEYGVPDLNLFPLRDWSWALAAAVRTTPIAELGDGNEYGNERLQSVLASYLRRVRGQAVTEDRIVIVGGFRWGLNVVLRALARRGITRIALEDPGPIGHDLIAERAGMSVAHVGVDRDGVLVDRLEATNARVVLVTPAHQSPTGVLLSAHRRTRLLEWARASDGYIIEDDYDAELRHDQQAVGALQGLAPDRVIAMGSTSKTLAPGLRLGWISTPGELLPDVLGEKMLAGRNPPAFEQVALAELIDSGRFDRHIRRTRQIYAGRQRTLVAAVAEHAPSTEVTGLAAGCHALLTLPEDADEDHVVAELHRRGVPINGLRRYGSGTNAHPPALVVGFGNVTDARIREGIHILGEVLTAAAPRRSRSRR